MSEYKGYIIQTADNSIMKEIVTDGKGSVAKELRGLYTSEAFAKAAIDVYGTREKVVKDGKATTDTGV